VDSDHLNEWQFEALRKCITRGLRIKAAFLCTNTRWKRDLKRNFLYYAIASVCMRHSWTAKRPWRELPGLENIPVHSFASGWAGSWQRMEPATLAEIAHYEVDFVVKFGMYLLRDADTIPARHGVLSYHHGDPSAYRGRPAGFYELLDRATHVGVMVQRIVNKLDAGTVLAFGRCRVLEHSYRATLANLYGNGTHLLHRAMANARDGRVIALGVEGRNCSLPGNVRALTFMVTLAARKVRRLFAGSLSEKQWNVARAPAEALRLRGMTSLKPTHNIPTPRGLAFLADPAVLGPGTILCEGLERNTGKGAIVVVTAEGTRTLDTSALGRGHLSYPHVVKDGELVFMLPEMAQIGAQKIVPIAPDLTLGSPRPLRGVEDVRLVDPTVLHHAGRWWLFAGVPGSAADVLRLWSANSLEGTYTEHPASPVCIDPGGARNAGPVILSDGALYRFGQDNRRLYGDGVFVFRISELTTETYAEERVGEIRVDGVSGPHTIDLDRDEVVFDHYRSKLNLFAWTTKLKARL
jgi:hypothetical protein